MDEKLKHRIVGGLVLFSVAVIAVPLLFDSEQSKKTVSLSETAVPPNPQAKLKTIDIPVVDKWSGKTMPDVVPEPIVSSQEEPPKNLINPVVAQQPTVKPDPEPTQAKKVVPKEVQSEEKPPVVAAQKPRQVSEPAKVETKPKLVTIPERGKAWVVQVGSFSERANAERLRDKLIKSGYRAFVSQSRSKNRTVVRVRVGPELLKENAVKLSRKLQKELSMQTMVVEHR